MEAAGEGPRILIVGLGNVLLQDDGVGVHAVRALQADPPRGALVAEVGVAVFDALHLVESADHILALDAMQAGGEPGAVYAFGPEAVAQGDQQYSLHELNLLAALRFLPADHPRPKIAILGVEPQAIDYGLELTPPVEAALPLLLQAARDQVAAWVTAAGGDPETLPAASWLPRAVALV
jgi:hydrogenase maturation protease